MTSSSSSTSSPPSPPSSSKEPQEQQTSSCPYANAMKKSSSVPGLIQLKECPAFSKECPFKGAKSAEEVAERLKQIPASHLEANGTFFKTLEYFHQSTPKSGVGGSCPVKHALPKDWSFDQAMEEYSLVAIMGRLAQEWEEKEEKGIPTSSSIITSSEEDTTTEISVPSNDPDNKADTPRLSDALKSGTAIAHVAAESVHFVKNFIRGEIDRDLYGLLVAQLYHVYGRLEQALDQHAPQHFDTCHFPKELQRMQALQEDLDFWHTTTPDISKATQDYIDRIEHLSKTNPLLLLAHAYTRYLGDLSGGKILARVARRALQLQADGLAFYEFPMVESFKLFKDHYRTCLNELPLTEKQILELVQEANIAFLLNMRLFEELDVLGGIPGATIRSLESVYSTSSSVVLDKDMPARDEVASNKCPFIAKSSKTTNAKPKSACPWPFIILHDPKTGFRALQTWAVYPKGCTSLQVPIQVTC
jgi:heme oxygenase